MVLTSESVPTGSEDKRPVSIPPGTTGGRLSSRRSRAVIEQVCKTLGIMKKDVTIPLLETCVDIVERALKDAQGRAVPKELAGKRTVDEDDGIEGKPCAACRGAMRQGDIVVPARSKDAAEGAVSWIHVGCVVTAANDV